MQRVSSVTAFVARHLSPMAVDPKARSIVEALTPTERRVLELLARVPQRDERLRLLAEETGERWEPARYDRVETLALLRLEHELRQHELLEP